jgi:hypothetical protein
MCGLRVIARHLGRTTDAREYIPSPECQHVRGRAAHAAPLAFIKANQSYECLVKLFRTANDILIFQIKIMRPALKRGGEI